MRIFLINVLLMVFSGLYGQDAQFTTVLSSNQVAAGERFKVEFRLNTSGKNFRPPSLEGFQVLSGPSQSSSMQWINGQMSSSISFSYILVALGEGQFSIGSASIEADGKVIRSQPVTVTVSKGQSSAPQSRQPQQHQGAQQQPGASELKNDLFIKLYLDKNSVYQGEQIIATYKIYTRVNIVNNEVSKLPSFNGFWSQEVDLPDQAQVKTEVLNGVQYNTAVLKKSILFPQRAGTLEVDPLALDVVIRVRDNSQRHRSVFDQFFGTYRDIRQTVASNAAKIEVQPLPSSGRPSDFSGAVGSFSLKSSVSKDTVAANDAINLRIALSGKGNIKLIEKPIVDFPPDFEVYDPKVNDNISATAAGVSGSREFDYLIIPRHAGKYSIEPFTFSFFDTEKKKYVTLSSGKFDIEVAKGAGETSSSAFTTVSREEVKLLGKDIRFIKTGPASLTESNRFFFGTMPYYALLMLPPAFFLLLVLIKKRYEDYTGNVVLMKKQRATRVARKRLRTAEKLIKENKTSAFYEELFRALYGYAGDKLNISISGLTKEAISEMLAAREVSRESIDTLVKVLDECEFARFAPAASASLQEMYEKAAAIIKRLEDEIR